MVLLFGSVAIGRITLFGPDFGKGKLAAAKIMALLDRKSTADPTSDDGDIPVGSSYR